MFQPHLLENGLPHVLRVPTWVRILQAGHIRRHLKVSDYASSNYSLLLATDVADVSCTCVIYHDDVQ
jgi:hypothetical protein